MFENKPSLWWNKAGTKVAFSEFIYDSVPKVQLPRLYQDTQINYQWPQSEKMIHFPLPGDKLPKVQLKVVNLEFNDDFDIRTQTLSQSWKNEINFRKNEINFRALLYYFG